MRLAAWLALTGLAGLLALGPSFRAQAQDQVPAPAPAPRSVVVIKQTSLVGPEGQPAQSVAALTILACLSRPSGEGRNFQVLAPDGREAALPRAAGLPLAEEPAQARQRLQRLLAVELDKPAILRALSGRIAVGDTPWVVETAWGPPQRRFMVNYFMDEEHFVYLRPGADPLLLRFKGGRLLAPLPAESLAPSVESPPPPR